MTWRVVAALCAVNSLALAVFVIIATMQFDSILSGLVRERLAVLAEGTKAPFQAVADLGLPVSTLRNTSAVLEEVRQSDSAILAVHIYGPGGGIVHSTARDASAPVAVSSLGLPPDVTSRGSDTYHETESSFVLASPFQASHGTNPGGVAFVYSKALAATQVRAMAADLGVAALAILLGTLLAATLLTRLALREHVRFFSALLIVYDRFERRFWRLGELDAAPVQPVEGLGMNSDDFAGLLERSETAYEAAIGAQMTTRRG
ncbi:MAG: hypothetical protein JJ911_10515 [Rhizobiaceae bacterium]|nr:hypothetical protein [Rhizobiaceae bacterium]